MNMSMFCVTLPIALMLGGCQSANHALRVGSDTASVNVLMTGLQTQDQGQSNWVYELSGCDTVGTIDGTIATTPISPATNATAPVTTAYGLLDATTAPTNTISFQADGLKAGLANCQFRVKTLQPSSGLVFPFEPNVLYWARSLTISTNPDGALVATAALERTYSATPDPLTAFTITAPVTFPAAEKGTGIIAYLTCTPNISAPGQYVAGTGNDGTFTFAMNLPASQKFACTNLVVDVAEAPKYQAALGTNGAVTGAPQTTIAMAKATLVLIPTATATDTSVEVSTIAGACTATQHYDSTQHACADNGP